MKEGKIIVYLGILFCLIIVNNVYAMPPPNTVTFELDTSNFQHLDGEWRFHMISVDYYTIDIKSFASLFREFQDHYIEAKKICGVDTNYETYTNLGGISINITNPECEEYKLYYEYTLGGDGFNFRDAFRRYFFKVENKSISYPVTTEIINNTIKIPLSVFLDQPDYDRGLFKDDLNYIFVIEKLNTTDEVYFSNVVSVTWNPDGKISWYNDSGQTFPRELNEFKLSNNKLDISLEDEAKVECVGDGELKKRIGEDFGKCCEGLNEISNGYGDGDSYCTSEVCGNDICRAFENEFNCPEDCSVENKNQSYIYWIIGIVFIIIIFLIIKKRS